MDYLTKSITREEIRKYAKIFRKFFGYDERHMLTKTIHLDHIDNDFCPHVHMGDNYHHQSGTGRMLTQEESAVVDTAGRIYEEWRNKEHAQR